MKKIINGFLTFFIVFTMISLDAATDAAVRENLKPVNPGLQVLSAKTPLTLTDAIKTAMANNSVLQSIRIQGKSC